MNRGGKKRVRIRRGFSGSNELTSVIHLHVDSLSSGFMWLIVSLQPSEHGDSSGSIKIEVNRFQASGSPCSLLLFAETVDWTAATQVRLTRQEGKHALCKALRICTSCCRRSDWARSKKTGRRKRKSIPIVPDGQIMC